MTVAELKEILEAYDDDMIVRLSYDYGDRSHTNIAKEVTKVEPDFVRYSSYHLCDVIDEREDVDKDDENECLILS